MKIYKHWIENDVIKVKSYECIDSKDTTIFALSNGNYIPKSWINNCVGVEIYTLTPRLNKQAIDNMSSVFKENKEELLKQVIHIDDTYSLWNEAFLFNKYIDEDFDE